jgi:hypothetical protein
VLKFGAPRLTRSFRPERVGAVAEQLCLKGL